MAKRRTPPKRFPTLHPNTQIGFYHRLQAIKNSYLQEALSATVQKLDISKVDAELSEYVKHKNLGRVASFGLRGEIFYPVPSLLIARPSLLGYYRLLYGFSQKEFYRHAGLAPFKRLEERNEVPSAIAPRITGLCKSLIRTGQRLVEGLDNLSLQTVRDLQLITVGPQLRGGRNTRLGQDATADVFALIEGLVSRYIRSQTNRRLELENESGRTVVVAFSSDPDIAVTENLASGVRSLVSVEIKGGTDISNIHNRIGEAEKSHQKAKSRGFFEFWTILGAEVDPEVATNESPTTTRFFHLPQLRNATSEQYNNFRDHLHSIIGIKDG